MTKNLTAAEWLQSTDDEPLVDVPITHPDPSFPTLLEGALARLQAEHLIATSLGELRRAAGLTQQQLSERWGCTQSFVSKIERDPASAEMGSLISYVRALGGKLVVTVVAADHVFTEELVDS
jgi:DNA-binding XRE family transcriptional regulator